MDNVFYKRNGRMVSAAELLKMNQKEKVAEEVSTEVVEEVVAEEVKEITEEVVVQKKQRKGNR